jgi:hypothetical protein
LYLLGHPLSSDETFSDKRLISSLIKESGNNCSLEIIILHQNIVGMNLEVGTQNVAKAYMPISNYVIQEKNQTSGGK